MFPGPADGSDLAVNAAVAETPWYDDGIHALQKGLSTIAFDLFRTDPMQIKRSILGDAGVAQGFHHREVGIIELDIFAH